MLGSKERLEDIAGDGFVCFPVVNESMRKPIRR